MLLPAPSSMSGLPNIADVSNSCDNGDMKYYCLLLIAVATLLSSVVYSHQSRPFTVEEWTSDWDGGPDRDSEEFRGSIAAGEAIARKRQSTAPYLSALAFVLVIGLGAALRAGATRLVSKRD